MCPLNTTHPLALQALMSETIFGLDPVVSSAGEVILEMPTNVIEAEEMLNIFGSNGKNILFIVNDLQHDFFSKEAELAFVKTLMALKLSLDDVAIINYKKDCNGLSFEQISKRLNPNSCVFLGVNPLELGLESFVENNWKVLGGIQFLYSFSFEDMLRDPQKKRTFWDAVKLINF